MPSALTALAKLLVDRPLDLLPRRQRARLWRHLLDRARGDNNIEAESNGEYFVLARVRPELARRAAVVLDVGANVGDWTVELCEGHDAPLQVHCFEPASATFRHLSDRVARLRTGARIQPVHAAVGSAPGEAVLYVYKQLAGNQSLLLRGGPQGTGGGTPTPETVRVVALDDFCAEHSIAEVGFVKIDVEGFDLEVMKGLRGMLGRSAVGVLQFEYNDTWIDARIFLRDAFELLQPLGYTLAKVHPRGIEVFEEYSNALDTFQFANYLAVRPDWLGLFPRVR